MKWIIFGIPVWKGIILVSAGAIFGFFMAAILAARGEDNRE
mgnify:CR=1 FL=1